jgi:hypothetical protein
MVMFDVQGVEILASPDHVFDFVRNPRNLPRWAHAFRSADDAEAELETPAGAVTIKLQTAIEPTARTVDWRIEFPDGSVGLAHSRVTGTMRGTSIYSFVLHAPPVPLEALEGALDAQRKILATELTTLKSLLE